MIKYAFLIGNIGYICCLRATAMWLMPYISPASAPNQFFNDISLIGLAFAVSQVFNAFIDPFLGKFISQIKRRRLFQYFSSIFFASFALMPFFPFYKFSSDAGNFLILAALLIIYLLGCSFFQTSFLSLLPVLAKNDKERSQYSTYISLGMLIGAALSLGGSGFIVKEVGIQNTIRIFTVLGFICMILSTFMLPFKDVKPHKEKTKILSKDFFLVFKNRYFVTSLVSILAANSVYTFFTITSPYITEVIIKKEHDFTSYAVGISFIFAVCFTPIASKMIKKSSPLTWMAFSLGIYALALSLNASMIFFSNINILLALYLGSFVLCGIGVAQTLVLTYVLLAESVAKEPKGTETAPIYHAFYNQFLKIISGGTVLLIGFFFEHLGSSLDKSEGIKYSFMIPLCFVILAIIYLRKRNFERACSNTRPSHE